MFSFNLKWKGLASWQNVATCLHIQNVTTHTSFPSKHYKVWDTSSLLIFVSWIKSTICISSINLIGVHTK